MEQPTPPRRPTKRPKGLTLPALTDAIRQGILANEFAPGQRLVEAELCERFGASRRTVQTALLGLAHEGLVERIANRGARVRVVELDEALHIAEARLALESLCVARAAERITDGDVAEIRYMLHRMEACAAENDLDRFGTLTYQLYRAYVRISAQPVAEELLERLRAQNARHRFRLTFRPGWSAVSLPYWRDLVDALSRRDPEAAVRAQRRHSANVQAAMRALAEEQPERVRHQPFAET